MWAARGGTNAISFERHSESHTRCFPPMLTGILAAGNHIHGDDDIGDGTRSLWWAGITDHDDHAALHTPRCSAFPPQVTSSSRNVCSILLHRYTFDVYTFTTVLATLYNSSVFTLSRHGLMSSRVSSACPSRHAPSLVDVLLVRLGERTFVTVGVHVSIILVKNAHLIYSPRVGSGTVDGARHPSPLRRYRWRIQK